MKPDILLFHPPQKFSPYRHSDLFRPDRQKNLPIQYLTVGYRFLYLAAYLKARGYNVECWNIPLAYHHGFDNSDILRIIKNYSPLLIGVDLSSPVQSRGALDLAKFLKTTFPNAPLFINGMHASFFGEEIMGLYDCVDILISGEAEKIVGEIAETVEAKKDYSTVIGIISRADGKIIKNEGNNIIEDVDQIPPYSCDFLMPKKDKNYSRFLILNPENRALITACAGPCKYDCVYCPNATSGYNLSPRLKTQFHSVDWILEQIEILLNDTNRFSIEGHCSCNGVFLKEVTHAIRKEGLHDKINFFNLTVIPSQAIDRELIGNFSSAGINSIDLGIESGSDRLLKLLKRPYDTKQVSDIIRNANKNEIITKTYWMITGLERELI